MTAVAAQLDIFEAIRQREAGMARVASASDYSEAFTDAIRRLASTGELFTADNVRTLVGDPPSTCSPNIAGALFNAAAKAGLIEAVDLARSGRVIGHGNRLLAWRGKR